ncbi:MAG: molecular chaperone TorD family protein [Proteobacteria bacterium]|nr:molecular chaperone TorD family protein [Pseudomonadota bacterium]
MLKSLLAIEDDVIAVEYAHPRLSSAELNAECAARADVYRLLSGVFVEEPGQVFVQAMRSSDVLQSLATAGMQFDADFTAPDSEALVERLACEYTTLFAATGGFPPVESVRLTGRYKQDPHFKVEQTYAKWGFVLHKGRFEVFPDQLGVELMFVAELLERCSLALARGDEAGYRRLEREVKRFWTQHLGRWVRGYARLIEQAAEHSFYREMARLLGGFADEEIAAMGLRIDDLDHGRAVVPKAEIRVEFNPDEPVCNSCEAAPTGPKRAASVHTLHDLR